jgi:hypothetical protein
MQLYAKRVTEAVMIIGRRAERLRHTADKLWNRGVWLGAWGRVKFDELIKMMVEADNFDIVIAALKKSMQRGSNGN